MNSFATPVVHDHDDEADDNTTAIEACMTCLSDDAALLHGTNPEDEVAGYLLPANESTAWHLIGNAVCPPAACDLINAIKEAA